MATINHVYFGGVQSISEGSEAARLAKTLPITHGWRVGLFERIFLKNLQVGEYYLFIIAVNQYKDWDRHCEKYDLAKYIKYKNPVPVRNGNYGDEERLRMYILQFDEEFVNKWKETK